MTAQIRILAADDQALLRCGIAATAAAFVLLTCALADAQIDTGTILGTIRDNSGAVRGRLQLHRSGAMTTY